MIRIKGTPLSCSRVSAGEETREGREGLPGRAPPRRERVLAHDRAGRATALLKVPAKVAQERRGQTPLSALFASSPAGAGGLRARGFAHECAIAFEERIDSERKANSTEQEGKSPPERARHDLHQLSGGRPDRRHRGPGGREGTDGRRRYRCRRRLPAERHG